ncbi:hypothetical protein L1049_027046 [Liquidambar formosana]|uniref:DUF659 domain-containing protein n=1 Tax=Liquidambar formosana TaxID=63359 RepID=A0AAP0R6X3_LIQFO
MICGFVPLGYNALRTTLLKKERANIEKLFEPIKGMWKEKGISIVTNGWSDARRRPLINLIAVTESGLVVLKAFNCEGEYKDKFYIVGLIKDIIAEVGPQNMVQVITDNAPCASLQGCLLRANILMFFGPHVWFIL